jgi:hypothetical protein
MRFVEFLLVGRSPLGSAMRAVVVAALLMLFWMLFFSNDVWTDRWTIFIVTLITALAVVIGAHLVSKRDNRLKPPPPHV